MFSFETFKQKSPQQRFLFILGLVMFLFYLILGGMLIFGNHILNQLQPVYRILLGCLLVVYAGIRFWRVMSPKAEE